MDITKLLALILIAAGVLGLAYGSVTFTKETHTADLGPIELSVEEKETVNIPLWAGVAAVAAGAGLLLMSRKDV